MSVLFRKGFLAVLACLALSLFMPSQAKAVNHSAGEYQVAGMQWLPDFINSEFGWSGNKIPDARPTPGGDCTGYKLDKCPEHGSCSKCAWGNKYTLNSCPTGYSKSETACTPQSCDKLDPPYRGDIPVNQTCSIVSGISLTCYKDCRAISCSGYNVSTCPSNAICTKCPDCTATSTAKGNCSPDKQKVTSCILATQKVNSDGTACVDKDNSCPSTHPSKSCSFGSISEITNEAGTKCYNCKAPNDSCPADYPSKTCPNGSTGQKTNEAGNICYKCKEITSCTDYIKSNYGSYQIYNGSSYISSGKTVVLSSGSVSLPNSGTIEFMGPGSFNYSECTKQARPKLTISNQTNAAVSTDNVDLDFNISSIEDSECLSSFEKCKYMADRGPSDSRESTFDQCMRNEYGDSGCTFYSPGATSCCPKSKASINPFGSSAVTMIVKDANVSSNAAVFMVNGGNQLILKGTSSISSSCAHKSDYGCRAIFADGMNGGSTTVLFESGSITTIKEPVYMAYSTLMKVENGATVKISSSSENALFVNQNGLTPTYYGSNGVHNYGTIETSSTSFHAGQVNNYSGSHFKTGNVNVTSSSWRGRIKYDANAYITIGSECRKTTSASEYTFSASTSSNPISGGTCTSSGASNDCSTRTINRSCNGEKYRCGSGSATMDCSLVMDGIGGCVLASTCYN